ncbi:MAG: Ig domain-containing protein [Bryobacterales bacterium]|nr:Ig domain-containing protein [Bryobacterales bacterium]
MALQVEMQEDPLAHSAWHASAMLCLLIAVGTLVLADTALADSSQAPDASGSTDISFPLRPAASAELDSASRRITLAGTKLTIPAIASAEQSEYGQMFTLIEIVNISDSDAELSFNLRDASGNPLEMPFYNVSCPACPAVALSSHSTVVEAKGAARLQIVQQNPARIGWAEFSIEPAAAVAVSGQIWFIADDGTVSFAGIPPTAAYRQAFLYLDNSSDFETTLALVNLDPANRQDLALHFRAADDPSVTCEASAEVPPFGQAVLTAIESLPCAVGKLGLLSIRGQDEFDEFTGIAFVGSTRHDGVFTRQFVQPAPPAFIPLRHWTVSSGSVSFGGQSSSGCLTVASLSISGAIHTVHSSRWQKRTGEFSPWDDVPDSDRVGQVCAYSPSDLGHYRGVAEISVDGTRGLYATSNVLAIGGQDPPGEASSTRFNVGDMIPDLPSGFWAPSLVETGKGASFVFSGGTVTLAWTSSVGAIQYQKLSWTCASSGGCEVVNGRVTKGIVVQSGGSGGETTPVDQRPRFASASVGDQSFTVGMAIAPLTLPTASGGAGTLTYSLAPSVPGLTFSPPSRTLSGTPSRAGSYAMTYTATDADGDTDTLNFTVSVAAGSRVGDGGGGGAVLPIGGGTIGGFELLAAHQNSRGIAWANDRFYVFNWLRRMVYAYTGTGQHDPDNDFAVVGIDVGPLHRFAYANGRFYLFHVRGDGGKLFAYAYTLTGQRDASRDLELPGSVRGIAYADGRFYVIGVRGEVHAYSASGDRDAAANFDLDNDNRNASGIVYAAGRLYVVDSQKVFAYTGSGTRDASADFALACDNVSPIGIAYAHGGFHVLNWVNRKIYTYAGIGGTSDSSPCFPGGSSPRSQTYTVGTPISTLTLPAARGGAGPLKYSLEPNVPGLSFDATTRRLTGTPSGTGMFDMIYTATDADGNTDTLSFTVSVAAGSPAGDGGGDGRFNVGDTIPDMPSGFWAPSLVETGKGASFVSSGGTVTLAWTSSAGVIQYQTLRWTCASSGGCEVVNRIVTKGTIVQGGESDGETTPDDERPRFGSARVSDQSFTVGTAIRPLTLPGASGGDGTLAYSLAPNVPGLSFDATTRRLTGTPSGTGMFDMIYTATDADGNTDTLSFTVSVAAGSPAGDGGGDGRFNVGDTIPDMPSGFWAPSLVETGKGASFLFSGGTVTLAWTSSAGIIQYNAFRWTCASNGGCEVVEGRVTKGTVVQSGTGG